MEEDLKGKFSSQAVMREDLQRSFLRRSINPLTLSRFQRIILSTDGTVTEMLGAYSGESMGVVKLFEEIASLDQAIASLELAWGNQVLRRTILLRGRMSLRNFLYAESVIALDRLHEKVRDGLLASKKPIGLLLQEFRIETFKEILDCGKEPAGRLAEYFEIEETVPMIFRTYRMVSGGRPIMLITEKFPESYFLDRHGSATDEPSPVTTQGGGSTRSLDEVSRELDRFIRAELLANERAEPIDPKEDLLEGNLIDSLGLFELLAFIDERFGVKYEDADLTPDNFRTLQKIAERITGG